MVAEEPLPSAALLKANRQLYELRKKTIDRGSTSRPDHTISAGPNRSFTNNPRRSRLPTSPVLSGLLPEHLGWDSYAVTRAIRLKQPTTDHQPTATSNHPLPAANGSPATRLRQPTTKLYPDIALGMLQQELTAAGRLWLLLRFLDKEGRGWLRIDFVRDQLTAKDSEWRVCGRRQLRNLLRQGRGIFWEQDRPSDPEAKIWLKSAVSVARALGVSRLTGHPVALPVKALLGGIGQVRAHLYATFHGGRRAATPISRAKLKKITHVPERTQRVYENLTGVTGRPNIAIGPQYSEKEFQNHAWRRGQAVFVFVDKEGRQGPAGRRYIAWRLPNSYDGCHEHSPKGRQRKINRQIDLVDSRAQGNGLERDMSRHQVGRLFYPDGLEASKAYNREGPVDVNLC